MEGHWRVSALSSAVQYGVKAVRDCLAEPELTSGING
jgi:hypothetical protein